LRRLERLHLGIRKFAGGLFGVLVGHKWDSFFCSIT